MIFKQMLNNINSRQLFLIDGIGAVVSAIMLGLVLASFESTFGMPKKVLYFLAIIPCFFAIYSFSCYWRKVEHWRSYLKIIALANLLYCCLTTGLMIYLYQKLTILGLVYFLLEIIVVIILVLIELKTASNKAL